MIDRRTLLAAAAAFTAAGCSAPPARAAAGRWVDLQLVDREHQRPLPEHPHRGTRWVAGRPGDRYAVRLANRSAERVLVVLSVDGVNAISGETASPLQTGYVLAPWQRADITGWRKSDAEAAAFYFTALPDSYAARTGRPQHVGVVAVAVFRERRPPPQPFPSVAPREDGAPPERRSDAGDAAAGRAAGAPAARPAPEALASRRERDAVESKAERLGTGHGEREYAPTRRTAFERASNSPDEIVQLRYDSHDNLVAAGILVPRRWAPDPFPGYVPDPRS